MAEDLNPYCCSHTSCVLYIRLQIESQNPQDPTKLKEIQFDLEDVPASLLQ